MKYIYLLLVLACSASCKKGSTPSPNNPNTIDSNSISDYWWSFIPNWYSGDTLTSEIYDEDSVTGYSIISGYDTIVTMTVKGVVDTSCIIHNGVKYYIWTAKYSRNKSEEDLFKDYAFTKDASGYVNVYVSEILDTAKSHSRGLISQVNPYKFKDENGQWKYQTQRLNISYGSSSPFKGNNTLWNNTATYWGIKKHND